MTTDWPWVTVKDLIDRGAIPVPVTLYGERSGQKFQVILEQDGSFVWRDQSFGSPSVAAGRIITLTFNERTPGRSYFAVNGWKFWKLRGSDGNLRTLGEIRDEAKTGAAPG